jgi:hypothetical protein
MLKLIPAKLRFHDLRHTRASILFSRDRIHQECETPQVIILAAFPFRAGDGARTHDSHVGNVALYH